MFLLILGIVILLIGIVLMSLAKNKDDKDKATIKLSGFICVGVAVLFTVLSMVDSYIINANVYGKTNSIHPLIVIFSVFAGSALFGIMGIVISFPLAILMVTTYKFYKDDIFQNIKGGTKKIIEK